MKSFARDTSTPETININAKRIVVLTGVIFLGFFSAYGQSCTKSCNGQNKCCKTMETQSKVGSAVQDFTPVEACTLTSNEQVKRYKELKDILFKKIALVNELPDGYDLVFKEKIEFSDQLIEFVNFERVCCPSFTFTIHFEPYGGPIHLEIKGSKGIKDIIAFGLKEYNIY